MVNININVNENSNVNTNTNENAMKNKKQLPPIPKIRVEEVMPKNIEDTKCAPTLEFENGSCYPLDLLVDMAEAFNKFNEEKGKNDKIILNSKEETLDPSNYKIYLLHEFKKRYNGDQKDLVKENFTKFMDGKTKDYMENNVFRPEGPQGKFEWLSTIDINQVLKQYEEKYPDFLFLGAVPIDFDDLDYLPFKKLNFNKIKSDGIKRIGVIFNLDEHDKSGSHWVSLFSDLEKAQVYFSDSYAIPPEKRISAFMKRISDHLEKEGLKCDVRYNKTRHQRGGSECGVYSINFILRLLKGKTFDHITRKRLSDSKVNKCRAIYFGNKMKTE